MVHSIALLLSTAVIALLFGLSPPDPNLSGEPSPLPNDHTLLAAGQPQGNEQSQVQFPQNQ